MSGLILVTAAGAVCMMEKDNEDDTGRMAWARNFKALKAVQKSYP